MQRALGVVICAAIVGGPAVAAAKPHVALLPITSDERGEVLDQLTLAVEDDLVVSSAREVDRALAKLSDSEELDDKDIATLVSELEVDVVVHGALERDRTEKGTRLLHLRVFAVGKKSHGFTVHFTKIKSPKLRRAIHDALLKKLAQIAAEGAPDAATAKLTKPAKGADANADDDADDGDDDQPQKTKKAPPPSPHIGEPPAPPPEAPEVHSANHDAVRGDLGLSAMARSFRYSSTNIPQAPRSFSQSLVPGARFAGELYPFAFGHPQGLLGGIGLTGDYDQTLAVTDHVQPQPTTPLSATVKHWSLGARYRIPFGRAPTSPTLALGVSYGDRAYTLDRGPLLGQPVDLPDVRYKMIQPALEFRLPIGLRFAITAGARYLLVRSAGEVEQKDQYGDGSVYGFDTSLGAELVFAGHFAVRVSGELTQLALSFKGDGSQSNDRDGDPTTKDVSGATDRYVGLAATFAAFY